MVKELSNRELIKLGQESLEGMFANSRHALTKQHSVAWVIVYKNGEVFTTDHQGCYGTAMSDRVSGNNFNSTRAMMVISVQQRLCNDQQGADKLTKEETIAYYDYLMNRSPLQEAFVSKNAALCLKREVIGMSVHCPSNLMMAGMFAARHQWEKPQTVRIFLELAERGVEENLAFFLTQAINYKSADGQHLLSFGSRSFGHMTLHLNGYKMKDVNNFLTCNMIRPNPPYRSDYSYKGIDKLFTSQTRNMSDDPGDSQPDGILNFIKQHYVPEVVDPTKNNPFFKVIKKQDKDADVFEDWTRCLDNVVAFLPTFKKGMGVV